MNITYNQTYLFPSMAAGQSHLGSQYPINMCGMNSVHMTPYDAPVIPAYMNGYATPNHVVHHIQNQTHTGESNVDRKVFERAPLPDQYRTITKVPNGHDHVTLPSCSFQTNPGNFSQTRHMYDNSQISKDSMGHTLTQAQSVHQLRLPTISVTSNMAANVMSEECDLGYCSFTDLSPLPEIHTDCSDKTSANELFQAQSAFADIIDDVLDSMDSSVFDEYTMPPEPTMTLHEHFYPTVKSEGETIYTDKVASYCAPCPSYPDMESLGQTHIGLVKTENPEKISCDLCNKTLQTKASLRAHLRVHKGEKPHDCSFCGKSFAQKSTLRTHIRTHTGEKPYVCQYCSRSFSDYSTYRKHVRVHTGEKPYACDVCHRRFTQSGNMIRHREMHFKTEK